MSLRRRVDQLHPRQHPRQKHLRIAAHRRLARLPGAFPAQLIEAKRRVGRKVVHAHHRARRAAALQQLGKVGKLLGRGDEHQALRRLRTGVAVRRAGKAQAHVARLQKERPPVHEHPRPAGEQADQLQLGVQMLGKGRGKARRKPEPAGEILEIGAHGVFLTVHFLSTKRALLSFIIARRVL